MAAYVCEVCHRDNGKVRPCRVRVVGEIMQHLDLCVVTGEFNVAEFKEE